MNSSHDPYVEDSFEKVLDAFKDSGWKEALDNASDKGYHSASQALSEAAAKSYEEVVKRYGRYWEV